MRRHRVGRKAREVLASREVPGPGASRRIRDAECRNPATGEGQGNRGGILDGETAPPVAGNRLHAGDLAKEMTHEVDFVNEIDEQRPASTRCPPPGRLEIGGRFGERTRHGRHNEVTDPAAFNGGMGRADDGIMATVMPDQQRHAGFFRQRDQLERRIEAFGHGLFKEYGKAGLQQGCGNRQMGFVGRGDDGGVNEPGFDQRADIRQAGNAEGIGKSNARRRGINQRGKAHILHPAQRLDMRTSNGAGADDGDADFSSHAILPDQCPENNKTKIKMERKFIIECHSIFCDGLSQEKDANPGRKRHEARNGKEQHEAMGMSRVLVTGGTGFVGLRTVAALHAAGHAVRIFDLAPRPERLPGGVNADIVSGDITDTASVVDAARGCDGIVHLAGLMTIDCARDPVLGARVNLIGSLNVFEAAKARRLPVAYLSTAGVFGPQDAVHPQPMTIYGATKLAVEGAARAFFLDHGVPSVGLRPYIVYGPGISAGIAAGPSIAIAAAVRREMAEIRFSGRVGFVHVDDVARLLSSAMTAPLEGATTLTMAGDTVEMTAFVAELKQQSGWDGITIAGPPLRIPADLASDPVPALLGHHPVTAFADGIRRSLAELKAGGVKESSNV